MMDSGKRRGLFYCSMVLSLCTPLNWIIVLLMFCCMIAWNNVENGVKFLGKLQIH